MSFGPAVVAHISGQFVTGVRAEASERQGEADEVKDLAWTTEGSNELVQGILPGGGEGNPFF